ncbi:hypothetical protein LMG33810_001685 [Carnimonas sp. LMG 33810]
MITIETKCFLKEGDRDVSDPLQMVVERRVGEVSLFWHDCQLSETKSASSRLALLGMQSVQAYLSVG